MKRLFEEEWSKIPGFCDYLLSASGRVLSYKRGDWRELHPYVGINGYAYVNLRTNGETIKYNIHRLVAETFIPNPKNRLAVNHIDGNKLNNDVTNLEWVTYQENSKHAYALGLTKIPEKTYLYEKRRTPIIATHLKTGMCIKFESQRDASDRLNISKPHINKALRGECSHAKGWAFEYDTKEGF